MNIIETSRWCRVKFEGAKDHIVHARYLSHLITDLNYRGYKYTGFKEISEMWIDFGGSLIGEMPSRVIKIDGLSINLWSHQAEGFERLIKSYPDKPRRFKSSHEYYKIHNEWLSACLVLTIQQRILLRDSIFLLSDEMMEEADEFLELIAIAAEKKKKCN